MHEMSKSIFSGKNMKNISECRLSPAEIFTQHANYISFKDYFSLFSALYRATINITSVTYSADIASAGRNIQDLTIVRDLEAALQKLLDTLPGLIRIRIVSLR